MALPYLRSPNQSPYIILWSFPEHKPCSLGGVCSQSPHRQLRNLAEAPSAQTLLPPSSSLLFPSAINLSSSAVTSVDAQRCGLHQGAVSMMRHGPLPSARCAHSPEGGSEVSGLSRQDRDCDPAAKSIHVGIRKNWIQICHICLVDVSSGKRSDLLEPLFLLL